MGVNITTIPQGKGLMRALNDEAESLIEMDRGRVIHIDRQMYTPDAEPIIGSIQHRRHECCAYTAPYPAIMHTHTQIGRVVLPAT